MDGFASIEPGEQGSEYLLPFGTRYYYVPNDNVMACAIYTNTEQTGNQVDELIRSRSPERWKRCLTYGRVLRIRGVEGNALYTTFSPNDGHAHEQRVLRLVPHRVSRACFPEVRAWAQWHPDWRDDPIRMAIYDWKKEVDLPGAPRLDPVLNRWPVATLPSPVVMRTVLPDPMADWDAHIAGVAAAAVPPPVPPPPSAEHASLVEGIDWNDDWNGDDVGPPDAPPPPATRPRVVVRRRRCQSQNLRVLSDFLFECKDLVPEGAYLAASGALKRVWDECAI